MHFLPLIGEINANRLTSVAALSYSSGDFATIRIFVLNCVIRLIGPGTFNDVPLISQSTPNGLDEVNSALYESGGR
jgi:hypothetical protein